MARCPNGTRKSKDGCVAKSEPIRCKNGTRKNSKGKCVVTERLRRKGVLKTLAFYGKSPFKNGSKFTKKRFHKDSFMDSMFKTASQGFNKKGKVGSFGSEKTW